MGRSFRRGGLLVAGLFFALHSLLGEEESGKIRILGIGNSFTANATKFLPQLIQENPEIEADIALAYIGGSPMDLHVKLAKEHAADPANGNKYRYQLNGKTIEKNVPLRKMLEDGPWDYVTIQQVSTKSYKIETYYPYAGELIEMVKEFAPEAKIILHETWSHNIDSHRYTDWGIDPDEMYEKLHAAYGQIAFEYGLPIIPVGTAFQNAKEVELWNYQPTSIDTGALVYPEDKDNLPDESKSLHRVFKWNTNKETGVKSVGTDGYHANRNGEYLGSLVWYGFFFGADPAEVEFVPKGMSQEQADSLQDIATLTLEEEPVDLRLNP